MITETTSMTSKREEVNVRQQRGGRPSGSSPLVVGTTSLNVNSWVDSLDGESLTGTIARKDGEDTETEPTETSAATETAQAA